MTKSIPHEEIRKAEDRSWSFKLLTELIECTTGDDMEDVVKTLTTLNDYRLIPELTRIMEDRSAAKHKRGLASNVLDGCVTWETHQERVIWWASGDEILMRHAVLKAERSETDLIEKIAKDLSHSLHAEAIEKLGVRFEEPRFQKLKINAMSHPRADVRAAAARAILWDEPVAAEHGLLLLAKEDDELAAKEALHALAYYKSQLVLSTLAELAQTGPTDRRERFAEVFGYVRKEFIYALEMANATGPDAERLYRYWLEPVKDILNFPEIIVDDDTATDTVTTSAPIPDKTRTQLTLNEICTRLDDANASWNDRWKLNQEIESLLLSQNEQEHFIKFAANHSDWSVREFCCKALSKLNARDALFQLLFDPVFLVRKGAAYYIRECTRDERIADRLWEMLTNDERIGITHAQEVLGSYVVHSADLNLDDRLYELACDSRETVRLNAIRELTNRDSRRHIEALVPFLFSEPLITWAVHSTLLETCFHLKIEIPRARELCEVDDVGLQLAFAEWSAGQR